MKPCAPPFVMLLLAVSCFGGEDSADLNAQTKGFFTLLSSMNAQKREERQTRAAAIKKLSPDKPPEGWAKQIGDRHKSAGKRLDSLGSGPAAAAAAGTLTPDLDARRKTALDSIANYDQAKIDAAVKGLSEIWDGSLALAVEKNAALRDALNDVKELDGYLALYPGENLPPPLDEKKLGAAFAEAARAAWIKPDWAAIMKYNSEQAFLEDQEKEHLKILNEYRMLLGLAPLEIDIRLWAAARGHSQDMADQKFFAHESPVPGKRSFSDRAALEGYKAAGGENIFMGSPKGADAFRAWYHSPGHHKNMTSKYRQIGVGCCGRHWTQLFGHDGPFAGSKAGKPPSAVFREKAAQAAKSNTLKDYLDVATFAIGQKLWPQAREQLDAALKLDPNHAQAKMMLVAVEAELAKKK